MQRDSAVRVELGISRETAARLAGVSRHTIRLFEADPDAVGEEKRAAVAVVYAGFRGLLASAPAKKFDPHGFAGAELDD